MAPLPISRINTESPFEDTGLDFFGPILCKMNGCAFHKVYVCVFTCLKSRSVHAELVYNMDTNSLINAIVRFVARRPGVKTSISDNGSNLSKADKDIREQLASCNDAASHGLSSPPERHIMAGSGREL